jgi:hypothetical protein
MTLSRVVIVPGRFRHVWRRFVTGTAGGDHIAGIQHQTVGDHRYSG